MNVGKKIWIYFKDSWEGRDGKFSYRRFSQYIFLLCMIKMGFKPPANQYELTVFIIFASLYAIIATIITAQQLIELLKYTLTRDVFFRSNNDSSTELSTGPAPTSNSEEVNDT